jgi:hypothetical protein
VVVATAAAVAVAVAVATAAIPVVVAVACSKRTVAAVGEIVGPVETTGDQAARD